MDNNTLWKEKKFFDDDDEFQGSRFSQPVSLRVLLGLAKPARVSGKGKLGSSTSLRRVASLCGPSNLSLA